MLAHDGRDAPAQGRVKPGAAAERDDRNSVANDFRRPLALVIEAAHD